MKKQTLLIASVCVIAAGGIGTLLLHRPKPEALCGTWYIDHSDAGETLTLYNDRPMCRPGPCTKTMKCVHMTARAHGSWTAARSA